MNFVGENCGFYTLSNQYSGFIDQRLSLSGNVWYRLLEINHFLWTFNDFLIDVFAAKPGMLDFKGKAKWEAWNGKQGLSKDDAMTKYIEKANELIASFGLK